MLDIKIKSHDDYPTMIETVEKEYVSHSHLKVVGYKIRRRSDGRYSTGGSTPEWTSVGKTWSNVGALHGHFAVIQEYEEYAWRRMNKNFKSGKAPDFVKKVYSGCELVQLCEKSTVKMEDYR